jgi:DMSO reductase family type II enzyme heme b subunit
MTKKIPVILIAIISVVSFAALVYYGLKHAKGKPVPIEEVKREALEVPFINEDIDLTRGISLNLWNSIAPKEIELMYQVTVSPWGKSLVSPINVKSFHNGKTVYFYITWKDDTENGSVGSNTFSDATAILFPISYTADPQTIMMGFLGEANIWQWKASQDREYWLKRAPESEPYVDFYYPFEEQELFTVSKDVPQSAANDLMAIRVGTITPKEIQNVHARGFWNNGEWHVVFKRSLKQTDPGVDAVFNPGKKRLCAFAVWNGENRDRGGRKSISDWVELGMK